MRPLTGHEAAQDAVALEQAAQLGALAAADRRRWRGCGTPLARQRAGDVDALAAGLEHRLGRAHDGAALEALDLDGAIQAGVEGER